MGRAKTDNIGEKRFCPSRFGTRSILRHPSAIYFLATRPSNCVYSNDRRLVVENTSWKEMGNRVLRLVAEDPLVNIIYIYIYREHKVFYVPRRCCQFSNSSPERA